MSDANKASQFDIDCMENMGKTTPPPLKRYRVRENWQDFASIWVEDTDGDWVYDPHRRIKT